MGSDWIECLDKRPTDRTGHDLDLIFSKLKGIKAFESFHPLLLQQLCYYGYYESIDKGVTLFRVGDVGTNWYVCLSGSVDVVLPSDNGKVQNLVCTLGSGTAFGESILYDTPRNATIITSEPCEILRVEQKDFKILWVKNREYMQGVLSSLSKLTLNFDPKRRMSEFDPSLLPSKLNAQLNDPCRNPALPIVSFPSIRIANSAYVLKSCIMSTAPQMIRDRKYHLQTHECCLVGSEMVDWLIHLSPVVHSRSLAVGMWQALLEEATIENGI
ncbi:rap guanine nucleotide exchange factor 4 isoform X1 [Brachionus plicatilis]|uniref:Rap guanine nucleotide exchange factor 4 isoform X1 n=1 Tax=Brachionus plicatilis TaxID=10195 RepID=A0A3M7P8R2_BRAPC|nr:rap guanine nucleotide exchange factor 4 isoform X1 [Brachionus plicatilis]